MKNSTGRNLRKVLSFIICLALVLSYVPMVGYAADAVTLPTTLYVSGVAVVTDGVVGEVTSGVGWSYDVATATLYLTDGADIRYSATNKEALENGIYCEGVLNVHVSGNVTITGYYEGINLPNGSLYLYTEEGATITVSVRNAGASAIISTNDTNVVAFSGKGTVNVDAAPYNSYAANGISAAGDIKIDGVTLNARGTLNYSDISGKNILIGQSEAAVVNCLGTSTDGLGNTLTQKVGIYNGSTVHLGDKVSSSSWLTGISSESVEIIDSSLIMDGLSGPLSIYAIHSTTTVSGASHVLVRKIEATDSIYSYGLTTGSAGYELTATQDYYCRTDSATEFALNANVEELGIAYFELYTAAHHGYQSNGDGTHYYGCPAACPAAIKGENEVCGGTATCTEKAYCEVCDEEYGELSTDNHTSDIFTNGFRDCCGTYLPATQNADGYYEIGNAGQLYWFAEQVNAGNTGYNAILLNDIIVNENVLVNGELNTDADAVSSFRQWISIGNDTNKYIGTFDGRGYEIKGLYTNTAEKQALGLFGYLAEGAVVKNLGVVDGYFADTSVDSNYGGGGSCDGGGIAKIASKATISKCYNTCMVKAGGSVGGIVGGNYSSRIEYCYNAGNVVCTAASNVPWYPAAGGIAGGNYSTTTNYEVIYSCYNIGTISSGFYYIGSINGSLTGYPSQNCYYLSETETEDGGKTAEQFASGEVAYLLQQGNTEQVWGQDSNQAGATPILDSTGLYKVVTVAESGNYSVANVGDTNGDGTVDINDYQVLVNGILSGSNEQIETASYDNIVKYDLNSDGYIDALDASLMHLFINGNATIDIYAVGDYDLNGVAFEEADILAMGEAMQNNKPLSTCQKYACDMNADGKVDYDDLNTLTNMFPLYFVGEE